MGRSATARHDAGDRREVRLRPAHQRWLAATLLIALAAGLLVGADAPSSASVLEPPTGVVRAGPGGVAGFVDPDDPDQVLPLWRRMVDLVEHPPASGFTGDVDACDAGTTSSGYRGAMLETTNALRALVGVAPVVEDPSATARSQRAALMMSANEALDHFPPATWECFSPDGASAAGESNLYLGRAGPSAMTGYVADPGSGNTFVGHRRWLLCPTEASFGFGDIPPGVGRRSANALNVFGGSGTATGATRDGIVTWPSRGMVPVAAASSLGLLDRFSAMVPAGHRVGGASVTITPSSGPAVSVLDLVRDDRAYCAPAVVWRPSRAPAEGESWTVRVDGLRDPGGAAYAVEWSTDFTSGVHPDVFAPFASLSDAVGRVHQWLLSRGPTSGERDLWEARLTAGTHSLADLIVALRRSADHVSYVDPVLRLYAAYFLRPPDHDGTLYWIDRQRHGASLSVTSNFFAGSTEFRSRYGVLTNRQFVERIYQNILGRPGEATGVEYWTEQLDSGRRHRGWVMIGFSNSPEYSQGQVPQVDAAASLILVADVNPTRPERDAFVARLKAGTPLATVLGDLLESPAVVARAQG